NRRSAKTHSGVYRDLAVRRRRAEPLLEELDGPLVRRTAELIHEIEEGRRICAAANLELLAAYARLEERGRALNAVVTVLPPSERGRLPALADARPRRHAHPHRRADGDAARRARRPALRAPARRRPADRRADAAARRSRRRAGRPRAGRRGARRARPCRLRP